MKQRLIYPKLKKHLKEREVTVLTGMRRTGKTTIVKELLKEVEGDNKIYLDLENLEVQDIFNERNYDNIIYLLDQQGLSFDKKAYIFLDEIQLVKNIPSIVKYLYDHYDIKFVLTGSSSYYIKNLFEESLSGRKKIFELYPLNFREFLVFKGIKKVFSVDFPPKFFESEYQRLKTYYEEYIKYGGFPQVVESPVDKKKDLLADIISSYINLDIKQFSDLRDSKTIRDLFRILASRTGTKIDYSKLSRLTALSNYKIQSYIELFESTYLLSRLNVYSKNADREIVKAQKLYFNDNGVVNFLADLSGGVQFENAISNQLRTKGDLAYYSLKTGQEIDFILGKKFALEVKETPENRDLDKARKLASNIDIQNVILIGRHSVPGFDNYVWGGDI